MTNTTPKVSIILPAYNHETFVAESVESVLSQTFEDFEFIITDDASTDKTPEVLKTFKDKRIKLFLNSVNSKDNMKKAFDIARGEYIALAHSDDAWAKDKLEKQVSCLDSNPNIGAVFTLVQVINEDGTNFTNEKHVYFKIFEQENRSREEWLRRFFFHGNCLCHPSILIRSHIYKDIGFYNLRLSSLNDFDMWIRLCFYYNIHIIQKKLVKFRILSNDSNISGQNPANIIRNKIEQKWIFDNYLNIQTIDELVRIFPSVSDLNCELRSEIIPYFLARLAFEQTSNKVLQLWGIEKIYNLLGDEAKAQILRDVYGLDFRAFGRITGKYDIYNVLR